MKKTMLLAYSMIVLAGLVLISRPTPVCAAENDGVERLDRLEQRVNQMAERQEQLMKRLGAQMEQRAAMGPQDARNSRPEFRPQMSPAAVPAAAPPNPDAARTHKGIHDLLGLIFLIGMICNILLATWIFTDIRKRGEGSGIFIALALVAGIPAALIYSLTRIGDHKT